MKAPRKPGRSQNQTFATSGSELSRLDLKHQAGTGDRNHPRLHRLRDLACEFDMQETVLQARTFDFHILGELETALKVARGDAPVQQAAGLLLFGQRLLAADGQRAFLRLDRDISIGEAGDG